MSPKSFLKSIMPTKSSLDTKEVQEALAHLHDPLSKAPLLETDLISDILLTDQRLTLTLTVTKEDAPHYEPLCRHIEEVLQSLPNASHLKVFVILTSHNHPHNQSASHPAAQPPVPLSTIKHVIAIASGKGGVGKSTTTVNLAYALRALGYRIGILDADIYGPSIPKMMAITQRPESREGDIMIPIEKDGIKIMSMGILVAEDTPVIWRGPIVQKAIQQFLGKVDWGALDILLIDMPPGTGDIQLTLIRKANIAGAIIVSTPQDIALIDAKKAIGMFQKVETPIVGLIENMSLFTCPHCQNQSHIFAHGGAKKIAETLDIPCLAEVPLAIDIRQQTDQAQHEQLIQDDQLGLPYRQAAKDLVAVLQLES